MHPDCSCPLQLLSDLVRALLFTRSFIWRLELAEGTKVVPVTLGLIRGGREGVTTHWNINPRVRCKLNCLYPPGLINIQDGSREIECPDFWSQTSRIQREKLHHSSRFAHDCGRTLVGEKLSRKLTTYVSSFVVMRTCAGVRLALSKLDDQHIRTRDLTPSWIKFKNSHTLTLTFSTSCCSEPITAGWSRV